MFRKLKDVARLAHVARVLARHRALVPERLRRSAPASLRLLDKTLGGTAQPAARQTQPDDGIAHGTRLAKALEKLGPAYIKLGQLLATRADLVGADVAQGLSGLHDRLPAFGHDAVDRMFREDFGQGPDALFEQFGPAVAAASIAQVHKARLDGQDVAVKILRPGLEGVITRDLRSLYTAAGLATRFKPSLRRLRPRAVVQTLDTSLRTELDLRLEAAAASEIAENTMFDMEFRVPKVYWDRTCARVLTMEWIDGIALSDKTRLYAAGIDRTRLGRIVLQSFLRHAMRDGFFHADMHPGNLFVDGEGRLAAVDYGIMGRLDRPTRRFMAQMLHGFIQRDYERVAEVHFEAGYVPRRHSTGDFALALRAVGEPIWGRSVGEMSMGRLLTQLFETTRRFDMQLQPSLLLLKKTMVATEGVARDLDPSLSIWECAKPVVQEWMETELGPSAHLREARAVLDTLMRLAPRAPELLKKLEHWLNEEDPNTASSKE